MFHAINTLYCIELFVTWNKQVKAFAYNSVYIFHLQKSMCIFGIAYTNCQRMQTTNPTFYSIQFQAK